MNPEVKKFDLQEHGRPLQVFIFTVQRGPMAVQMSEDVQTILAHDEQSAMLAVRKTYLPGALISVNRRAVFPVERLLKAVNLTQNPNIPTTVDSAIPPLAPKEMKEREFINAVLYIADRFVKEKRDQTSLKRIINKLLKNYEHPSKDPAPESNAT